MNEPTEVVGADAPGSETTEAPLSILEHAETFSKEARQEQAAEEPAPANETPAEKVAREQRRDQEGKFQPGYKRSNSSRAKSHQATPADLEKINEYTRRIKTIEESVADIKQEEGESQRAFELRRRAELVERVAKAKADPPAQREPPRPQFPQPSAQQFQDDPEPREDDPKYADNYPLYLKENAQWAGREQYRQMAARDRHQQAQQQRLGKLQERFAAAKADLPDFEQVAFTPVPWQPGSLVDNFIHEDDGGAKVLYYLQSHPVERDSLGGMTEFQATKFLTQLSLRLLSDGTAVAGANGAAPRPVDVKLPPKPPTPLRTEAQRVSEGPPPTDGSLSILQHRKKFGVRG